MVAAVVLDAASDNHERSGVVDVDVAHDGKHLARRVVDHRANECRELDLRLGRLGVGKDVTQLAHLQLAVKL